MRVDGCTFREIGEKYGVSKQFVSQYLFAVVRESRSKIERYPGRSALAKYMDEHELTVKRLAEMAETSRENLMGFMTGRVNSTKTINKLIKVTGLTYEELMKEELTA